MSGAELSLREALATTRAIRRYTPDPIPDADLAEILWFAGRAPSGTNRQRFRFIVLRRDDPVAETARSLLGDAFRTAWVGKQADLGVRVGTGAAQDGPKERMAASMQHYVDHVEEIPVIVLVGLERYRAPNPYEGASVYPACQNLLLAARALGYGGALTGFHHAVEDELRAELGIPETVALSACITLGVPAGRHGPLRRKPIAGLVHDARWGRHPTWIPDTDPWP
ncbi:MAG: nitroreductase family protein [Desertimonas sp.]